MEEAVVVVVNVENDSEFRVSGVGEESSPEGVFASNTETDMLRGML